MKSVIALALATMAFTSFAADMVVTPVTQSKAVGVSLAPLAPASAPVAAKKVEKKVEKKAPAASAAK